ncbi:MAG: hypothetical protein ACOH16_09150 [Propionibacteriaceae bacterium]
MDVVVFPPGQAHTQINARIAVETKLSKVKATSHTEGIDLAGLPEYADVQAQYSEALHEYLTAIHDPVETTPLAPAPARSRAVDSLDAVSQPNWVR